MKRLLLCVACLCLPLLAAGQGAAGQSNSSAKSGPADRDKAMRAKAFARCKANRGVDCETPEGLKEWLLQERTRRQAVKEGSRHRPPPQK